ncbi:MAG: hypothetical protein KUG70_05185 [Rhodobacteraceae bacterium]|nr:hypothetical protein [Paracoccaceae bacterium]
MSKKLIVHIGLPKSGTTTIQFWAYKNRHVLETAGVLYPTLVRQLNAKNEKPPHWFWVSHHILPFHYRPGWIQFPAERRIAAWNQVAQACETGPDTVFLSSEAFGGTFTHESGPLLAHLRKIAGDRKVVVLLYLRDHSEFIKSIAFHRARQNEALPSFEDFSFNLPDFVNRLLKYREICDMLRASEDVDELIIRPFDPQYFPNGDLIADLKQCIGVEAVETEPLETQNTHNDTFAMRAILEDMAQIGLAGDRSVRQACYAQSKALNDASGKFRWSAAHLDLLRTHYRNDRSYLEDLVGYEIFPLPNSGSSKQPGVKDQIAKAAYGKITGQNAPQEWNCRDVLQNLKARQSFETPKRVNAQQNT